MRRLNGCFALCFGCAFVWVGAAQAQMGRGGSDWTMAGGDAQRSQWVRTDPKISVSSLSKPGFALTWKIKLTHEPTLASTLDFYIGYRGFRALALMGSGAGAITAIDTDLGRVEWTKSPASGPAPGGSGPCAGGMTADVARPGSVAFPNAAGGRGFGGGRGGPAKSGVGQPGDGAVTIAEAAARAAAANEAGRGRGPGAGRGADANNPFGARVSPVMAISSDGALHTMYVSNGEERTPAMAFLPANAHAEGLTVIGAMAYAATAHGCGGAPNGVWALDLTSKQTAQWTTPGDIAGASGFAFGPDGTIYAATNSGQLAALDPKTLAMKGEYRSGGGAFTSTPAIFDYKSKATIAAATDDGHIHIVDAAGLKGAPYTASVSGELASWQDAAGARWVAAPAKDTIAAWKVTDQGDAPALQSGWKSREMASPLTPIVVNGVVFAVANSSSPVLYALDGATGKELWNSGTTMKAPIRRGGLSGSGGQIFLGTSDGTIYAFGFPIEH